MPAPQPITTAEHALAHVELVLTEPLGHEHACMLLDAQFRPSTCIIMEASASPDDALVLVEFIAEIAADLGVGHLMIVTSRPGGAFRPDDINRWFALDHCAAQHGLSLLEWFVCDEQVRVAVSALAGGTPRWPVEGPGQASG